MNDKSVVVSRYELQAAKLFACDDETRLTLCSVLVESTAEHGARVVATDGRRLVVMQSEAEQSMSGGGEFQLLLKPQFVGVVVAISKALGDKAFPWVQLTLAGASVNVSLVGPDVELSLESSLALVAGEYPQWEKCLPPRRPAEDSAVTEIGLNAGGMADFAKAATLLGSESPVAQIDVGGPNGELQVHFAELPKFYGLVMGCHVKDDVEYQPEFVHVASHFKRAL